MSRLRTRDIAEFSTRTCVPSEIAARAFLAFGKLLPSAAFHGIGSLTVEATEQRETLTEDGEREVLSATSSDQLLDEIATVISFCLNVVCVRDHDMTRRLISGMKAEARKCRVPPAFCALPPRKLLQEAKCGATSS